MSGLLVGVFAEFNQGAYCGLGVKESDVESFSAFAGSFVDEAAAFTFEFAQSVGHAVFNCESYVLDASATAVVGDKLADGAVFRCAFEQLEFGLAYLEESGAHFLVSYFFDGEAFEAKHFFVEGDCLVEAGNGDADVFDMRNIHGERN